MAGSYIPLYRKYRPQKFSDVVGQEAIVKTLSNAIELKKVAHAYLFTGPRGTGKTSSARIFAKSLNCHKGPTVDPCGECPSCIDIANGSAIDVIEIDAASNRKVEDARNLLEKVQFAPVSGKFKIYIIDEVHMLTTEAFNTLLKTLEEPPQNLVFILATTEAHKVLNTIISRCQRFDFRRIKQDLIFKRLKEIIETEKLNIKDQALSLIARRSSGGLRDALSLLDQVSILSLIQENVTEKDVLTLLGSLQEDTLASITDSIADKDSGKLISMLDEIIQLGNEPVQILRELINHFRNLMLVGSSGDIESIKPLIDVSEEFYGVLEKQSKKFEVIEIAQIIEKLSYYEKILKTSSQQHLWLEVALVSICHRHDIQVVKELENRISRLEEAISGGNIQPATYSKHQVKFEPPKIEAPKVEPPKVEAPKPVQETVAVAAPQVIEESYEPVIKSEPIPVEEQPEVQPVITATPSSSASSGNLKANWELLLSNIDNIPLRALLSSQARPVEINANKIVITFKIDVYVKQASGKKEMLENAAKKAFGTVPAFTIRTPSNQDEEDIKKNSDSRITPPKKDVAEQTPQIKTEPVKPTPRVAVADTPAEPIEDEVLETLEKINTPISRETLPEQARIVLDLFQGKIID